MIDNADRPHVFKPQSCGSVTPDTLSDYADDQTSACSAAKLQEPEVTGMNDVKIA